MDVTALLRITPTGRTAPGPVPNDGLLLLLFLVVVVFVAAQHLHARDTDPRSLYATGAPAEAVDPRTLAAGSKGRKTERSECGPPSSAMQAWLMRVRTCSTWGEGVVRLAEGYGLDPLEEGLQPGSR
ncbi:DUF6009 family protein [Wenjunlia tyrosinilytica]|uniref:Uncharacterized protein n=1 Tax=Wenjunlia tyrosinilytica TaxID=1544741 RepID=A0A917ZYK2_9ACTN|nr:DUF6009 family protein [Wenjunlia tyrosinilytica]GGP00738.1 hypothetical protein GCM10012280_70150 [Wenjunlia tyrosinilytica]